ncbi:MAG: hypothetical protein QNJ53_28810 [Pleurocapsa sp. MO_192.B19]|nr:hypothetical protein [Pleurocapsa sp. MO_192.B19]
MQQPRTKKGTFESQYKERRGQPIALRLPESLDAQLRDAVDWKTSEDNPKLKQWIEEAIAARLSEQNSA